MRLAAAAEMLVEAELLPDVLHTSVQRRAIRTAQLTLDECDRLWIPVRRSWRLERAPLWRAARQRQEANT